MSALMYLVCCHCGELMGTKDGPIGQISHGICDPCFKKAMAEFDATGDFSVILNPKRKDKEYVNEASS